MRERITSSQDIDPKDIIAEDVTKRIFSVKSSKGNMTYKLNFSATDDMPHCECFDLQQTLLPCKHFVAVMTEFDDWNWSRLPDAYRNSPYLTLDRDAVFKMYVIDGDIDVEGTDEMLQEIHERLLDLPRVKRSVTTKSACCRELLKELKSLTYIVYDEEATTSLQETPEDALEEFKKATVKDNGIPVEDKVIIEKTKDAEHRKKVPAKDNPVSEEQRRKTLKIPIRKGKRNAYSGRVGISSDIKKKASKLDINDYLKKEEPTEFVEPVYPRGLV